jgi:valyl-tRNA synthetase
MSQTLSDRYDPKEVEVRIYKQWEDRQAFASKDQSTQPPYCIVLPPPNVTGQLHIGHALNHTIQDILVRWKRMSGFNANWIPGTDHAGIATQGVVERELAKESLTRKEMGREAFVKRVWEWKEKYGGRIVEQMKYLGESCDWNRFCFTLDEGPSLAVKKVFVELHKKGLIYRGQRLINWSPKLESALSDLEVEYKDIKGHLYHIRYPIAGTDRFLVVATTRPETMLGDVAVAVNPTDPRYADLVGKKVKLPLTQREIPVIADDYVDKEFGSGVVKITPAHDFNDYEVGLRHKLPMLNILNTDGTLNENGGTFKGLKVQEARKKVLEALTEQGLIDKEEAHSHSVGHCSRSGAVAEPMLSEQWFLRMEGLARPARAVVENGTIVFEPESWTKVYLHWLNNIKDWCISRQLWWGHRIPAWYCKSCQHITVAENTPEHCEKCKSGDIHQDEDVLDTWFSSALWPFSTLGWPKKTEALKTFYPTDVLITGHDIIFFWVARMVMMGLEFCGDVPFRKVLITGLVRNEQGQKMSKSLGNALDPVQLIEEQGADALRFTLAALMASGRDLKFSTQRLEGYRNFMNKIWNATRFSLGVLEDFKWEAGELPNRNDLSDADKWMIFKTGECEKRVHEHLSEMRFADAANVLYDFVWHNFCDWYLEFIKPTLYGEKTKERAATQRVLAETLNRICRLMHPITPFITEEIYQKLPIRSDALILDRYPHPKADKEWLSLGDATSAEEVDLVCQVIGAIRNIRGENRIKPGEKLKVRLVPRDEKSQKVLQANRPLIENLGRLGECEIADMGQISKCALTPIRMGSYSVDVVVFLEGVVDLDEEKKRLEKTIEKLQKESLGLQQRLGNENFVKNAPPEVVETGRQQIEEISQKIKTLQSSLALLN